MATLDDLEKSLRVLQAIRGGSLACIVLGRNRDGFTISYQSTFDKAFSKTELSSLEEAVRFVQESLREEAISALKESKDTLDQARADYDTLRAVTEAQR